MNKSEEPDSGIPIRPCSCTRDPFTALPSDLLPRAVAKNSSLRRVTCPACDRVYQTNRKTDLCLDCEGQGVRLQEPPLVAEE